VPVELNKRKKRRLDASPAPSDISSARASPAPGGPPTPSLDKVSRSLSRSLSINTTTRDGSSAHPEPTPSTASSQPPNTARSVKNQAPATMTKKERREALLAQLPLKEGRPVAFKPPVKGLGKGSKVEPGSTDWIWAKVVRCISGDKNRYEVQDVQDAEGYEGKPGA
jgi:SAGA-associated factor 29